MRSYHINSSKIFKILRFKPKKNIEHAIKEICTALKNKKYTNPLNNDLYFNVKTLLKKKIY